MKKNDHRTRVTKMLIRRAFTDLLRQKPIQSITVKSLCDAAGINRGTFYAHYDDIYDLLHKVESEMMQDLETVLKPLLDMEAADLTHLRITTEIFRCLRDNADICTVTLGPYGDKSLRSACFRSAAKSTRRRIRGASPRPRRNRSTCTTPS